MSALPEVFEARLLFVVSVAPAVVLLELLLLLEVSVEAVEELGLVTEVGDELGDVVLEDALGDVLVLAVDEALNPAEVDEELGLVEDEELGLVAELEELGVVDVEELGLVAEVVVSLAARVELLLRVLSVAALEELGDVVAVAEVLGVVAEVP